MERSVKRLRAFIGLGINKDKLNLSLLKKKTSCGKKGSWVKVIHKPCLTLSCFFVEFISLSAVVKSIEVLNYHSLSFRQMKMDLCFSFILKTHQKITREGFLIVN